jgi:hypothetical protein
LFLKVANVAINQSQKDRYKGGKYINRDLNSIKKDVQTNLFEQHKDGLSNAE